MFNVGDKVVYKHDVCVIKDIKKARDEKDYYVLVPFSDNTLKIELPTDFGNKSIKNLISKEYALELISKMPKIDVLQVETKLLENEYKKLLSDETHESLIKIIKTTYLRNKERIDSKRKVSDKDDFYFRLAEKYLYNELSIVFNMSYEETKEYILREVSKN